MLIACAFLGLATYLNIRRSVVPNWLVISFLIAILPVAWLESIPVADLKLRLAVSAVTLLFFFVLFCWHIVGGGAAKLITVAVLWLPWVAGGIYSILGVSLAVGLYIASRYGETQTVQFIGRHYGTFTAALGLVFVVFVHWH